MSIERVVEFWQATKDDEALRNELSRISETDATKELQALVAVGARHGFDFSANDYRAAVETHMARTGAEELDDAELGAVAGGARSTAGTFGLGYGPGVRGRISTRKGLIP